MKITELTISVSKQVKLDTGYGPYMEYVRELRGKPVPFGTRDQSTKEASAFFALKATLDENDDEALAAKAMFDVVQAEVTNQLKLALPSAFRADGALVVEASETEEKGYELSAVDAPERIEC